MGKPNKCIEARRMYGSGPYSLEIHRDLCDLNIDVLFRHFFGRRDKLFGCPPEITRRIAEGNDITYTFYMEELAETFFGNYSPLEFMDFLSEHFCNAEGGPEESLIYRVRTLEQTYALAAVSHPGYGTGILALNFDGERLWDLMKYLPDDYRNKAYGSAFKLRKGRSIRPDISQKKFPMVGEISYQKRVFRWVHKALSESFENKSALLIHESHSPRNLNLIDLVYFYDFPRKGLTVVKSQ